MEREGCDATFRAAMILTLSLVSALLSAPSMDVRPEKGMDALVLPLLSYNPDLGFGYGGVAGAYFYRPGYVPYRHAIAIQYFATSRGVQNHFLRYDGPRLIGSLRVEARLEYRRELLSPFYGAGNISAPFFGGDQDDQRFNYDKFSPAGWIRLRGAPWGAHHPFQSYVTLGWRNTNVNTYEGSVLEQDQPVGIQGGKTGQLAGGVLWDTRDEEGDPSSGGLSELAFRFSSDSTLSRYRYVGVTAVERRFIRLNSRLVFAQRFILDALFGEVPFFEWPLTGGILAAEGVGGMSSVRGLERNRFAGNWKAFSNSEMRVNIYNFSLFKVPLRVGAVGFLDLGRVWATNVDDGPWYRWHPGVGGGIRLARRAAVVRIDYAMAPETLRQGFYVTFGQMF